MKYDIPEEGLKIVAIAGILPDGKALWKHVGLLTMSKKDKPVILLDKMFNPAGVNSDNKDSSSILLNLFPFSQEELDRRVKKPTSKSSVNSYKSDYDNDDIPF